MSMGPVVLVAIALIFASGFGCSAYVPLVPFLVSHGQVGTLLSAQGCASCSILVPAGLAVDRLGSIWVLRCGAAVAAASFLLSSASVDFEVQLLGRVTCGIGGSCLFIASIAMIMERFKEPLRSEHIGTAIGIGTLSNLVGPPLAGYLYALARARALEYPVAVALFPGGVLLTLGYALLERVPKVPLMPKAGSSCEERACNDVERSPVSPLLEQRKTGSSLCLRFFGIHAAVGIKSWVISGALCCLFGANTALTCAGSVEMATCGFSTVQIGATLVPAGLLQVLFSKWGGRMSGTPRRRVALMILGPLVLAAILACSAVASLNVATGVVLPIVVTIGTSSAAMAAIDAPSISLMADLAILHGGGYGEAMTATELWVTAGQALGPMLGAFLLQAVGFSGVCLVLAGWAALTSAACGTFLRNLVHLEPSGGPAAPIGG